MHRDAPRSRDCPPLGPQPVGRISRWRECPEVWRFRRRPVREEPRQRGPAPASKEKPTRLESSFSSRRVARPCKPPRRLGHCRRRSESEPARSGLGRPRGPRAAALQSRHPWPVARHRPRRRTRNTDRDRVHRQADPRQSGSVPAAPGIRCSGFPDRPGPAPLDRPTEPACRRRPPRGFEEE